MAKPDGRIEKGQKLGSAISARRWNDLCDAADIAHGRRPGIEAGLQSSFQKTYNWVYLRNSSGTVIARHDAVRLDGAIASANTDSDSFVFVGVPWGIMDQPSTRSWGVALEPIAANSVGKVAISGVVKVIATIKHSEHRFLRTASGTSRLQTSVTGEARMLANPGRGQEQRDFAVIAELGRSYEPFVGLWDSEDGDIWEHGQSKNIRTTGTTEQPYYENNTVSVINLSGRASRAGYGNTTQVLVQPINQDWPFGSPSYVLVSAFWKEP